MWFKEFQGNGSGRRKLTMNMTKRLIVLLVPTTSSYTLFITQLVHDRRENINITILYSFDVLKKFSWYMSDILIFT